MVPRYVILMSAVFFAYILTTASIPSVNASDFGFGDALKSAVSFTKKTYGLGIMISICIIFPLKLLFGFFKSLFGGGKKKKPADQVKDGSDSAEDKARLAALAAANALPSPCSGEAGYYRASLNKAPTSSGFLYDVTVSVLSCLVNRTDYALSLKDNSSHYQNVANFSVVKDIAFRNTWSSVAGSFDFTKACITPAGGVENCVVPEIIAPPSECDSWGSHKRLSMRESLVGGRHKYDYAYDVLSCENDLFDAIYLKGSAGSYPIFNGLFPKGQSVNVSNSVLLPGFYDGFCVGNSCTQGVLSSPNTPCSFFPEGMTEFSAKSLGENYEVNYSIIVCDADSAVFNITLDDNLFSSFVVNKNVLASRVGSIVIPGYSLNDVCLSRDDVELDCNGIS